MDLKDKKFIDLFAGIGGFHQALSRFGAKCVFASEWDKHAAHTYEVNYQLKPEGDITKIDEKQIPKHDILCAGFPCQAFSISGKQKGFSDLRGTLFFDIARIVAHHQPEMLLLENVKNLARHDQGKTLQTILKTLEELNYQVYYKILNASHFGLPQHRERIYFVCFHNRLNVKTFSFPIPPNKPTSLAEILEKEPNNSKHIQRNDIVITKQYQLEKDLLGHIKLPNRPIQIGIVNKGGQGERIYHTSGHAITLSAYGGGIGSKTGLYKVGNIIRKLTPRECARLQGFPDSFQIISSTTQAYQQFGNSIAINVLDAILESIHTMNPHHPPKQLLGSQTARDGFINEKVVIDKFNLYKTDYEAQEWLAYMGYDIQSIQSLTAIHIPPRINKKQCSLLGITPEKFEETQKFKKADIQIQLNISVNNVIYRENISLKKATKANFNQVDKRSVDSYQSIWHFNQEICHILKCFTGTVTPSKTEAMSLKDARRWYLNELPPEKTALLLNFLRENKSLIVSDVLKGRGFLAAEWFLVTKSNENNTNHWVLKNINEVINFYSQGDVIINKNGNLNLGRITIQRKGGTPDPTSLQFKIRPLDLFQISPQPISE